MQGLNYLFLAFKPKLEPNQIPPFLTQLLSQIDLF